MYRGSYKTKTKDKTMRAAWQLFQEKGYDDTTIEDILKKSETSRSAFYHHFHGKDELLFSIAYSYDNEYADWLKLSYDPKLSMTENLIFFNHFVLKTVEKSPFCPLYPSIYGLQVMTDGVRPLINPERNYYQILQKLLKTGLESGELQSSYSFATLTDMITSAQIGVIYAWNLHQKSFSLTEYGDSILNPFLRSLQNPAPQSETVCP